MMRVLDRHFVKYLRQYDMEVRMGGQHASIFKQGRFVGSMTTSTITTWHYKEVIRQCVARGALPRSALHKKFG
jgi:hypothetical protein